MPTILWQESVPSGTSAVGFAPSYLRSVWTSLAIGLGTDLFWASADASSDASLGDLRPGGSRTFVGTQSASSNATDALMRARAFFASDTSRLFVYESNGTYRVGTPFLIENGTSAGTGVWVAQSGADFVPSAGNPIAHVISFPQAYSVAPTFAHLTFSERSFLYRAGTPTTAGVGSSFSWLGPGAQSAVTISWRVVGLMRGAI